MPTQNQPDATDEGQKGDGDSPVIQELRQKLKEKDKAIKELQGSVDDAVSEARAQVKREVEVQNLVNEAGYSKLADVVMEKLEGEPTAESVARVLEGLGLQPSEPGTSGEATQPQTDKAAELAKTANLGSQVAAAASGATEPDVIKRLQSAESMDELVEATEEAGLNF